MPEKKKDVIVIGGGPAGYVSAIRAAQLGAAVTLVEKEALGGTCLNVGCIPTKALARTAELYARTLELGEMGIRAGEVTLDFTAVQERKKKVVQTLQGGVAHLLKSGGVEHIQGEAALKGPGKVEITAGKEKPVALEATNVIIATGSCSVELSDIPFDGERILDSNQALELKEVPSSMLVIGGGVIGMEFASIFAHLGCSVTLVELLPEILTFVDEEVVNTLKKELARKGVVICTSSRVVKVESGKESATVTIEKDQKTERIEVEKILVAVGRKPNSEIGNKLGIVRNGAISVNERMETTVKGVYAAGDVIGNYLLAHVAYHEGIVAAENCTGNNKTMSYRAVPQGIFTHPEVACIGLTEKEAREKYGQLKVGVFPFAASGKAMAGGETAGFAKIIASKEHDEIVGVFMIGPSATEMIHQAALAMNLEATLEEVAETIHAHPTLSESFGEASFIALGRPLHFG